MTSIRELFDDIKGPLSEPVQLHRVGDVFKIKNPYSDETIRKRTLLFEKIREKLSEVWKESEFEINSGCCNDRFYIIVTVPGEHRKKMLKLFQTTFPDVDILVDCYANNSELDRLVARLDNKPMWKRLYNYFTFYISKWMNV
jgi:hypothetical protein